MTRRSRQPGTRDKALTDLLLWTVAGVLAFPLRQPSDWSAQGIGAVTYVVAMMPIEIFLIWRRGG